MGVPGSNLLDQALTIITPTEVTYYQALGRQVNLVGEYVTTFAEPEMIYGSWQPVPRSMYPNLGLDLTVDYWVLYLREGLIDVQRDAPPDQIGVAGSLYQCESAVPDWFSVDGWIGMLCVLIAGQAEIKKEALAVKLGDFSKMFSRR